MCKSKTWLTLITSIMISIFIVSFSIIIVLNFRLIYYFDIKYLKIAENTNLKESILRENYDAIINYILDRKASNLNLPNFKMSQNGKVHFEEVKGIFKKMNLFMYLTGFFSFILFIINLKKSNFLFFKHIGFIIIIVVLTFIGLSTINFNLLFNNLHKLIFKNDYWIFDPLTDPVINILPENFFMHELILILIILLIIGIANYILYIKFVKCKKVG